MSDTIYCSSKPQFVRSLWCDPTSVLHVPFQIVMHHYTYSQRNETFMRNHKEMRLKSKATCNKHLIFYSNSAHFRYFLLRKTSQICILVQTHSSIFLVDKKHFEHKCQILVHDEKHPSIAESGRRPYDDVTWFLRRKFV